MTSETHIILAGCGNMGYALLKGWLSRSDIKPANVHVVEPVEALRTRAAETGANAYGTIDHMDPSITPTAVVVAVKPQVMAATLLAYRRYAPNAVFISIAAGVAIETIESRLGPCPVVRAMPNTPASIGQGMTVTYANAHVSPERAELVADLLASTGEVRSVDSERLVDAATAISGSGPAYLFHFIECLASAGETIGLDAETSLALARQTVRGAAELASARDDHPSVLRREVTSPNGTTAAALEVLMRQDGLPSIIREAANAAFVRALELSTPGRAG